MTCEQVTANAKLLNMIRVLRQLKNANVITDKEYKRAKEYYYRLLDADIVVLN